jgi:hypothetical protein
MSEINRTPINLFKNKDINSPSWIRGSTRRGREFDISISKTIQTNSVVLSGYAV